ncbi:O-antigen ligase family protein [Desulfosporosinus meridiei]|uniref:Lipid A core-O-antigen ligase-like enyme n=1 Tax=Desulfosporosinus meridiei (strain ATCC BAA-275 / DSM 13257 / KCTC 12902 / NCIMB 13706 / S10) TaxID=768704 RepID=J7IWC9_DESMD|nr:O-antigen ligase family protein [Desulfosporosinus meridiei]AFQ46142.1 lipid A core-O-antigen ligase-like enyme [Desulfosporosinus meridiei DSM 13257]
MKRWGGWIIPLFFALVPWDISKVLFPPYQSAPETPTSLTFLRIGMILLLAWGAARFVQEGIGKTAKRLSQVPLIWAVIPLFLAVLVSLLSSVQPQTTLTEGLRLLLLLASGVSIALGADRKAVFDRVFRVIFAMATLTAIFGLIQYLSGNWIWGGGINISGVRRVNASFIDPNLFARYLDISILGSLLLFIRREWTLSIRTALALFVQLAALGVTFSRTGWLTLLIGILILAVSSLRNRRTHWSVLGLGGLGAVALFLIPSIRLRFETLFTGVGALGQREHLLKGGWAMFIENPLTGVGLGNFQWALEQPYHYLVPWSDAVTRSHTSLMTVAAEMGILGIIGMLAFLIVLVSMNLRVLNQMNVFAQTILMGVFVIWLSSQGEGRFFEDPMIWAFWGLSLAIQWKPWGEGWDG